VCRLKVGRPRNRGSIGGRVKGFRLLQRSNSGCGAHPDLPGRQGVGGMGGAVKRNITFVVRILGAIRPLPHIYCIKQKSSGI